MKISKIDEIKEHLNNFSKENSYDKLSDELDVIINDNREKDKLIGDFISSLNEIYTSHEKTCKLINYKVKNLTNEASSNLILGNISSIDKIKKVNSRSKNKSNLSKDKKVEGVTNVNNVNSNINVNTSLNSNVFNERSGNNSKNNFSIRNITYNETSGNVMPKVYKNQENRNNIKSPYLSTLNEGVKYKNPNNITLNHNKNKSLLKNQSESTTNKKGNYNTTLGNENINTKFNQNYGYKIQGSSIIKNGNSNMNSNINKDKEKGRFGSKLKEFYNSNNNKFED